jgi:2-(1,2-epoxy-1,2-dihydrophenyl)acetyl-CoA isomerase
MSEAERVALRVDGHGIARLTLVRADARNAIDPEMVQALARAVEQCARTEDIRALLIRAEGRAFSVGGDLNYLGAHSENLPGVLEPMVGRFHETLANIAQLHVPVVCGAKGAVAGGALGLLWCADVTIVSEDCRLATGFLELGLSGDGGSTWWLPRLIGLQRARQLMLYRGPITGALAAEWGLVTAAVPVDTVDKHADRAASALAARPSNAYAEIRALLANAFDRDLAEGLSAEHDAMLRTAATDESRRQIRAFITSE